VPHTSVGRRRPLPLPKVYLFHAESPLCWVTHGLGMDSSCPFRIHLVRSLAMAAIAGHGWRAPYTLYASSTTDGPRVNHTYTAV
jgi:hypothetical protein